MRKKKEKQQGKKTITGILLSILFTAIVPIGFVFLMGMLSERFPVLYFYTKQIFVGFIVLLIIGIVMIIYQIYQRIRQNTDPSKDKKQEIKKRREQRRAKRMAEAAGKHMAS